MSSSRNTNNNNKAGALTWLPWVLLLIVVAAFIWLFTSMKTASEQAWEPPRTMPAEQQALAPASDTPAPIASYHMALLARHNLSSNLYHADDGRYPICTIRHCAHFLSFMVGRPKSRAIPTGVLGSLFQKMVIS